MVVNSKCVLTLISRRTQAATRSCAVTPLRSEPLANRAHSYFELLLKQRTVFAAAAVREAETFTGIQQRQEALKSANSSCSASSDTPKRIRLAQRHQRGAERVAFYVDGHSRCTPEALKRPSASHSEDALLNRMARRAMMGTKDLASQVFLPLDFPESVSPRYLPFVRFVALQILASSVSRVLSTQAMLLALGLGAKAALPMAVVTAWILKDGLGHLGAIGINTFINRRFDSDPKRYRFQAAVLGKCADTLSIFTLGKPEWFLVLSTLGSTCGRISQSTVTNCRAKVYETFAVDSNIGDVLRCAQSQSTAMTLLGTGIGVLLGPVVGTDMLNLLGVSFGFSALTVFASYRSSSLIQMATLNIQRAERIFHGVLADPAFFSCKLDSYTACVPSLGEVQDVESFVMPYTSVFTNQSPIVVNPQMGTQFCLLTPAEELMTSTHIIGIEERPTAASMTVALWLVEGAKPVSAIRGFFEACIFRELLKRAMEDTPSCPVTLAESEYIRTRDLADRRWPAVLEAMHAKDWRTDVAFLDLKDRRLAVTQA